MRLRMSVLNCRSIGCDTAEIGRKNIKFCLKIMRIVSCSTLRFPGPVWGRLRPCEIIRKHSNTKTNADFCIPTQLPHISEVNMGDLHVFVAIVDRYPTVYLHSARSTYIDVCCSNPKLLAYSKTVQTVLGNAMLRL